MDKEFEKALNCVDILKEDGCITTIYQGKALETIRQALIELKSIKEANPSEALKQVTYLSAILPDWQRVNNGVDSLSIIKQALTTKSKKEQAFDIIKEREVDVNLLNIRHSAETYNDDYYKIHYSYNVAGYLLTEEEFDLLKEVLNDNSQE
jgi:hypothetical protein